MSTLPRGPSEAADAHYPAIVPVGLRQHEYDQVVHEFESAADTLGVERPQETPLRDLCQQVVAFTSVLFPGEITLKVKNDPEGADDLYFVIDVVATGSLDEFIARSNEWHLGLRRIAGNYTDLFCLSFDVH